MRVKVHGVTIECTTGDIAAQRDMDAVVNAANAWLRPGGGVAGAIHRAAGPGLERECQPLAPIEPGQAVLTDGHNLPSRFVIHCLGPVYGHDEPSSRLLAACYRNALLRAEEAGVYGIAFPALSTGAFGYPIEEAARIALQTVIDATPRLDAVGHIRFVLHTEADLDIHARILEELTA